MSGARGMQSLTAARLVKIAGGLATHGVLGWAWGAAGYGQFVLALSVLGLLRLFELHTSGTVTALVPLLLAEGRGRSARRVAWLTWALNGATALLTSAALWLLRAPLAEWAREPFLSEGLAALALWNLLPLVRGPIDADLLLGLRAWRPLLGLRACEQGGVIGAALWVATTHGTPGDYFHTLAVASLPAVAVGWALVPVLATTTGAAGGAGGPVLRRFLRTCLPLTLSQVLFRLYCHAGAPLLAGSLSVAAAGSYKLALNVADLVVECAASVPQALQSELAQARQRGGPALRQAFAALCATTRLVAVPTGAALVLAPAAAAVVGRFQHSAFLLALLAAQVLLRLLAGPASQLFLALEQPGRVTRANAGKLALELLLAVPLVHLGGAVGLVLAHGLAVLPSTLWLLRRARAELGHGGSPEVLPPVTMVTNSPAVGGLERHVLDLVGALTARGVACHLICPEGAAIDGWAAAVAAAGARSVTRAGVGAPWDLPGMARLARALAHSPGLLHFHLNSLDDLAPGLILATLLGRRPHLLGTLQLGRGDAPRAWSPKGLRRRAALPLPSRLLAVSAALQGEVVPRWRTDASNVVVSRNGIDVAAFAADPGLRAAFRAEQRLDVHEFALLFVGRLAAQKGVGLLLDALGRLTHELLPAARVRLFVAGDGPLRAALEAQAQRLGVAAVFLGSRPDVRALMSGADLLVLPSLHEGLPFVLVEAMAAGLPVVATRVGGVPEIVTDGETGLLAAPADASALAWTLGRAVKMPMAERRRMAMAGLACVRQRFTLERQVDDVLHSYARLAGVRAPGPQPTTTAPTEASVHAGSVR